MHLQKGKLKFSQKELWNFDSYLSKIIYDGLEQFKQMEKHSVPPNCYDHDTGVCFIDPKDSDLCDKKWVELIENMQFAFKEHLDYCDIESFDDIVYEPKKFTNCTLRLPKFINGKTQEDYDTYTDRMNAYHKDIQLRKEKGLQLFAKYFYNLWD